jgi:4-hydroxy-tetrahydrodipicolinate reductase
LVPALLGRSEFKLIAAVARATAGRDLGEVLGLDRIGITISPSVSDALAEPVDVMIDYTTPEAAMDNVRTALDRGSHVVLGTSGLTGFQLSLLDEQARAVGRSIVAAGNFSLTAALMQHLALVAAPYLASYEIVDYAKADKPDAPSGTARELAERLSGSGIATSSTGSAEQPARGKQVAHSRVHSIRLPSYSLSCELIFGLPHERLTLRYDCDSDATVYVEGTLLAAGQVGHAPGLTRGLDRLRFDRRP